MSTLELRVSNIEKTMATKDQLELAKAQIEAKILESKVEMHSLMRQQIMWNVGSIIAVAGLVFAILRFAG